MRGRGGKSRQYANDSDRLRKNREVFLRRRDLKNGLKRNAALLLCLGV